MAKHEFPQSKYSAPLVPDIPEARFHYVLATQAPATPAPRRKPMPKLVRVLKGFAKRDVKCTVTVRHYNGRVEEGLLKQVHFNRRRGTVRLVLKDHREGQRDNPRKPVDGYRPIVFQLEHAEHAPSPGRYDICLDREDSHSENGFSISINTVPVV